mgnify:CR=1 FL=1
MFAHLSFQFIFSLVMIPLLLAVNFIIHRKRESFFQGYVNFLKKAFLPLGIVLIALTAFLGFFASRMQVKTDFLDLLPEDTKSVAMINRIRNDMGGLGFVVLAFEGYDPEKNAVDLDTSRPGENRYSSNMIAFVNALAKKIKEYPDVRFVQHKLDLSFFTKNRYLFMDVEDLVEVRRRIADHIEFQKRKSNPLYIMFDEESEPGRRLDVSDIRAKYDARYGGSSNRTFRPYFYSDDKRITAMLIRPKTLASDIDNSRLLLARITNDVDVYRERYGLGSNFTVGLGGLYSGTIEDYDLFFNDLNQTGLLAGILIFIVLMLFFRNISSSVAVTLPLGMGIIWTIGLIQLTVGYFNVISSFTMSILGGLGIEIAIHILSRYREEKSRGYDVFESLYRALEATGDAVIAAAFTSTVAFYSIGLTGFRGLSEFGYTVGTGMVVSILAIFTLLPILIILAEKIRPIKVRSVTDEDEREYVRTHDHFPYARIVVGVMAVLIIAALVFFRWPGFEFDFNKMRGDSNKTMRVEAKLNKLADTTASPAVFLANGFAEAVAIEREIERRMKLPDTDTNAIRNVLKVQSIKQFVPDRQPEKLAVLAGMRDDIKYANDVLSSVKGAAAKSIAEHRRMLNASGVSLATLPDEVMHNFRSTVNTNIYFVLVYATSHIGDGRAIKDFSREMRGISLNGRPMTEVSGLNMVYADMFSIVEREGWWVLALTILAILIVVYINQRSLKDTVVIFVALTSGLALFFGLATVFGVKLNYINILTIPVVIGIGIDSSVHMIRRYRDEPALGVMHAIKTTGMPVFVGALTNALGFGVLALANYRALRGIAYLIIIGMISYVIIALVLLPAMIQIAYADRSRAKGA